MRIVPRRTSLSPHGLSLCQGDHCLTYDMWKKTTCNLSLHCFLFSFCLFGGVSVGVFVAVLVSLCILDLCSISLIGLAFCGPLIFWLGLFWLKKNTYISWHSGFFMLFWIIRLGRSPENGVI